MPDNMSDTEEVAPGGEAPATSRPSVGRKDVARALGVSISTVRRLEGTELHPWRDSDDAVRFDPAEVDAFRRRRELAAKQHAPESDSVATGGSNVPAERPRAQEPRPAVEPGSAPAAAPGPAPPEVSSPPPASPNPVPLPPVGDAHGELAARCFPLFNAGQKPRDVVIALRMAPATVVKLFEEWLALGGLVALPHASRAALATVLGHYVTDANVVSVVDALVAQVTERRRFCYPCSACGQPIVAEPDEEWRVALQSGALEHWRHGECPSQSTAR